MFLKFILALLLGLGCPSGSNSNNGQFTVQTGGGDGGDGGTGGDTGQVRPPRPTQTLP
ncbi:hypothetical protein SAMN05421747_12234 [Parapedobacter composti]|uniref:Uncharacterized protein n=1 Tax=Parapedobacter composti TaxID=623281 RepID=A0A1I1LW71_9SPHI|nr:hypothetical protein SAMN05421747_12234 [Parapedobacter composti]